jgi:hypothetical protein
MGDWEAVSVCERGRGAGVGREHETEGVTG